MDEGPPIVPVGGLVQQTCFHKDIIIIALFEECNGTLNAKCQCRWSCSLALVSDSRERERGGRQ